MRIRNTIITSLCLFLIPGSVRADSWLLGLQAGVGLATVDNIDDHDTIGTGEQIDNVIDGEMPDDETDEGVPYVGVSFGRLLGSWHLEADLTWRYRTDWDISTATPSINTITNVHTDIETLSLLFNVTRRQQINERWSWFAGGGIGVAHQKMDSRYVEREAPGVRDKQVFRADDNDTNFAWNLTAGMVRRLNDNWNFSTRYSYVDLGELEVGPYPGRDARLSGDHRAHELTFAFERRLSFR